MQNGVMDDLQVSQDELLRKKVIFGSMVLLVGLVCAAILQLARLV